MGSMGSIARIGAIVTAVTTVTTAAIAAILASLLAGCTPPAPPHPNILLITLDTTRADRLGPYGYTLAKTPVIDKLAKQGVVFENAISSAPITLPSHSTIMTGLLPPAHGVRDNGGYVLSDKAVTLAERLKPAGYETRAFVSAQVLNKRYNLGQGFDSYDDDLWAEDDPKLFMIRSRLAANTVDRVVQWFEGWSSQPAAKRKPFFTWMHLFDAHQPYRAPRWARAETASAYDAELMYMDRELGRLFDELRNAGTLDNTLVILTADHGESLGEHDEKTHAIFVYRATTHVPLIMRLPGTFPEGRRYTGPVRHVDIVPTVLGLLGLPGADETQGVDLRPLVNSRSDPPDLPQYSESLLSEVGFGMAPLYAIRQGGYTFIRAPRPELYDLAKDPNELSDVYPDPDRRYAEMERELDRIFEDSKRRSIGTSSNPMSRETMEMLQSMGYLQGVDQRKSMGGVDPKDGIRIYNLMEDARHLAQRDKWPEAEAKLREILATNPANVSARSILALAQLRQGRFDDAQKEYMQVLADDGDKARCYVMLATIAMLRNRLDDAERFNKLALEASPDFVEAANNMGMVALLRGDQAGARAWYDKALAIDPTFPHVYRRIGDLYFDRGDFNEALGYYEKAIKRLPRDFRSLLQAGNSARALGNASASENFYAQAQKARPESWLPAFNIACLQASGGNVDKAFDTLRKSVDKGMPLRVAMRDSDLRSLRADKRFAEVRKAIEQRTKDADEDDE